MMAGVTTTALLVGGGLAAGAAASGGGMSGLFGKAAEMAMPKPPKVPKPEDAAEKARKIANAKRSAMTQTVYSSPLGISGQASVARKTLGAG